MFRAGHAIEWLSEYEVAHDIVCEVRGVVIHLSRPRPRVAIRKNITEGVDVLDDEFLCRS